MTQVLTDANQKVVWKRLGYNLKFNLNQGLSDPDHDGIRVENNFGFPGQYYDAGTSLYYNWNRYYDPDLGRYTRPDPIGLNGGLNPYRYAGNNPVMFSDPTGLRPPGYPMHSAKLIKNNCEIASKIMNPYVFRGLVKNSQRWDYKQLGAKWENFGNYNFGVTGAASGLFTLETLLREAGKAQKAAGTSKPEWCPSGGGDPYCDDPNDQYWILQGWNDYQTGMYSNHPETGGLLWGTPMQHWGGVYSRNR